MKSVTADGRKPIIIGKCGEKNINRVLFPRYEDFDDVVVLLHKRFGDEHPYAVNTTISDSNIIWNVGAADTAVVGLGLVEVVYKSGDKIAKSVTYNTRVLKSVDDGETITPSAAESWVQRVVDLTAAAQTAAQQAQVDISAEAQARISGDAELDAKIADKQNILTAGENITIVDDVISATGGATYTAGDGIEISGDVISALLAENGGLEFVDGKLSVAKVTTKPFNEDTYNDFVLSEGHGGGLSTYDFCFTTLDENGDVADSDTYLESGKFKIMVDCEENSYNVSYVFVAFRDADGNVSNIEFSESSCTVKSIIVEFTDDEKHIYIEKYSEETEDYSDAIENATGIYEIYIKLSNEYRLPEVTYNHEVIEDGIVKLSGAPAKQLEAGMGIEIINGKIQSIPHYRSDEYLGAPQPYIALSYGDLNSMGNDFSLIDGVISFNQGTLSNPIRLTSQE